MPQQPLNPLPNSYFFPKFRVNSEFSDFWKTTEGIAKRLEMLCSNVEATAFNRTIELTAGLYGAKDLFVDGPPPKCPYCIQYYGQHYALNGIKPIFPTHPGCDHTWNFTV